MDKKEYAKQLSQRLNYMLEENVKAKEIYKKLGKKIPDWTVDHKLYWAELEKLQKHEREIYLKDGVIYSNSAIKRVRIELNTVLIEIEKE